MTTLEDQIDARLLNAASLDGATPEVWTPDHVAKRLVEAFRILDALPRVAGPRQAGNHWPRHRVEWADQIAQAELPEAERRERSERRTVQLLRPGAAEIARMDDALEWLRELRTHDTGLALVLSLWALRTARRRSVRSLCRERGWAPDMLYKQRGRALNHLAATLNGRGVAVS